MGTRTKSKLQIPVWDLSSVVTITFLGSGVPFDCSRLTTYGSWGEAENWVAGVIPAESDDVVFPVDSGLVVMSTNVTVSTLLMGGGALVTHTSTCPPGWTPAPGELTVNSTLDFAMYNRRMKCWRVFGASKNWKSANEHCASEAASALFGGGAFSGRLAVIQSIHENQWASRLCRADLANRDCWIGIVQEDHRSW
ncbi:unnamed protein product [Choristocarpus tenellus]